jgi:chitodextrinase
MTWNTKPPADAAPFASLGAVTASTWYDVDVSSLVTGDGVFSVRVSSPSSNKAAFKTKEASAAQRPQLVVDLAPGVDTSPPTAVITSPASGASVSGAVDVAVTASDDTAVSSVDLLVDGQPRATDGAAPFVLSWNTTTVANGTHELTAVARDAAGKTGSSPPVSVTVANVVDTGPPTAPGGLVATADGPRRINLGWTASQDDVGVAYYAVLRDGAEIGSNTGTTYRDDTVAPSTTYGYTVVAYDAAGRASAPSAVATATTPAAPPSTTVTLGAAGDFGAGTRATATLAKLNQSGVGAFLAIGDLHYGESSTETAWCNWVKSGIPALGGASFPFQLVAGNHEDDGGGDGHINNFAACLPDRLGSTLGLRQEYASEYYFDYPAGNPLVRVFGISPDLTINGYTYRYSAGDANYRWLSDSIDAARAQGIPWIIVGMHMPCLTASSSGCSSGPALFNLLLTKKVDLVLQGHNHNYQRSKQLALNPSTCPAFVLGGFDQDCVVDGGSGVMRRGAGMIVHHIGNFGRSGSSVSGSDAEMGYFNTTNGSANGFVKYTISRDRLDATYVVSSGSYTDSFSISADGGSTGDGTPPTAPTNLTATTVSHDRIDLAWTGSTDDVGVDHYTVFRDGVAAGSTTGTSFSDGPLEPGRTYSYVVRAYDLAGNTSGASNSDSATTQAGSVFTFAVTADATIRSGAPTTNYGTSSSLSIDASPSEQALIKLTVNGVGTRTVASAKLRLYNDGASNSGGVFTPTATADWTETGVTWNTAPAAVGPAVATLGAVASSTWYEVDLTSLVRGDGVYSLRVTTPSTDGVKWRSKQASSGLAPQLVVTLAP